MPRYAASSHVVQAARKGTELKILLLVYVLAGSCVGVCAQDSNPYANDPCGDPRVESSSWAVVEGNVNEVVDGDTVVMTHKGKRLRVELIGIEAPALNQRFGREAQEFLERLVKNAKVGVWVSSNWWFKRSIPKEILGVVYLGGRDALQVNLELMRAGLARYKSPPPYKMSNYSACHLAKAEESAQAAKLGLWSSQ